MPSKEELLEKYRQWPDDYLLDEYSKREDYNETAQDAMHELMSERGLLEKYEKEQEQLSQKENKSLHDLSAQAAANSQHWEQEQEKKQLEEIQQQNQFDSAGVLLDATLLENVNQMWTMLTLGIGLGGWIIVVLYGLMEDTDDNFFLIALGITIFLTVIGLYFLSKSRGRITIQKDRRDKIKILIKYGKKEFELKAPFKCNFYAYKTQQRVNGIKTGSYFTLILYFHTKDGKTINLTGSQGAFGRLPEGWEWIDHDDPKMRAEYSFTYQGRNKMKLNQIKMLLNPHLQNA